MKQLLYATTNQYKLSAANVALRNYKVRLVKLQDNTLEIDEIQSDSQEVVAVDKARKYYASLQKPLIVMDFGFFINGLNGFPGVYTKHAMETVGVDGLINLVRSLRDRSAYTMRTIVYMDESTTKIFSSRCPGEILLERHGNDSEGYDTVFYIAEKAKTLAEMTMDEKAALSGSAWHELGDWLHKERQYC